MVMRLKERTGSYSEVKNHLKGKRPLRAVACGRCGWLVAARTIDALLGAGWVAEITETMDNGDMRMQFACATCASEAELPGTSAVAGRSHAAIMLAKCSASGEDAFPAIGEDGEQHKNTSRPRTQPRELQS